MPLRFAPTLAAAAVAVAGLTVIPSAAHAADAVGQNSSRSDTAGAWLAAQLTGGIAVSGYMDTYTDPTTPTWTTYPDYGLSADVAFAEKALGASATVATVANAVAPHVADWYDSAGTIYSGSLAKAAALAQVAGLNPRSYGGKNLISLLEGYTADAAPITGRIENQGELDFTTSEPTDSANTLGQIFAARALTDAGSGEAAGALSYLLQQQCASGAFRQDLTIDKTAAAQGCTAADKPSTDTTALAVIELAPLSSKPGVAAALKRAAAWLISVQRPDGGFGDASSTTTSNANSTGTAGWALGELGHGTAASKAATWIANHQVGTLDACVGTLTPAAGGLAAETGAIASDDTTFGYAKTDGAIAKEDRGIWVRAAAQAAPALRFLGAGITTTPIAVVKAKAKSALKISGLNTGETLCVKGAGVTTTVTGPGTHAVKFKAKRKGKQAFTLTGVGAARSVTLTSVKAAKLRVKLSKHRVRKGRAVTVIVKRLASGEPVTVRAKGKKVGAGVANARGVARVAVTLTKRGTTVVKVVGGLETRHGKTTLKVVR